MTTRTFDQFIQDAHPLSREWVVDGNLSIYTRTTVHYFGGQSVRCVDLANFGIEDEELRGQGEFTAFLEKAERIAQELDRTVFVESLVNEQLYHFLCRRGYVPTTPDEDWNGASLYKKVT